MAIVYELPVSNTCFNMRAYSRPIPAHWCPVLSEA